MTYLVEKENKTLKAIENISLLLDEFHQNQIVYCHWKSTEHLTKSIQGTTDLDILIDRKDSQKVFEILAKCKFKRLNVPKNRSYNAVEDFLSFDFDTGRMVHLHLHYRLTLGERHLKGYRLPWEELMLNTRIYNREHGIYSVNINLEYILLYVRSAMKVRNRDLFLRLVGKNPISWGAIREFEWLLERVNFSEIKKLCIEIFGVELGIGIEAHIQKRPTFKSLLKLNRILKPYIKYVRTYNSFTAGFLRRKREGLRVLDLINKKTLRLSIPFRRTVPTGGVSVAILGPDGSGKSTMIKELVPWFSKNFDVKTIYMGSGEGASSVVRGPMRYIYKLLQKVKIMQHRGKTEVSKVKENQTKEKRIGTLIRNLGSIPWGLSLAYERKRKLKKCIKSTNRGIIVIMDRFPQKQNLEAADAPKLTHLAQSNNRILRKFAEIESNIYEMTSVLSPDLIIKLQITPSIAVKRKSGEFTEEMSQDLTNKINNIQFPNQTKEVKVNADKSKDEVLAELKSQIWEIL